MMKFLVLGTLITGTLVLLSNVLHASRSRQRSRRSSGRYPNPRAVATATPGKQENPRRTPVARPGNGKIRKTEEQWKAELTEEQYRVTRCGETERPFTGRYWNHREEGIYQCVGCGQDLFSSAAKFDSGSGWPGFHQPVSPRAIQEIPDISYGMVRTEIVCSGCEGHLGHVFTDGPRPTGLRYCINSAALEFTGAGTHTDGEDRPAGDRIASGQ